VSVAFRRESDEEHKEPRFELPLPPGPNIVTARGLVLTEAQCRMLEGELATATTDERRAEVQRDLRYWRTRLATAQVAPPPSGEAVQIGMRVTLEQGGRTRILSIVGYDEADPKTGLIAFGSPLGKALIGAEAGDEVELNGEPVLVMAVAPGGEI
jgi:transcription elongation GreA/GreB family factor